MTLPSLSFLCLASKKKAKEGIQMHHGPSPCVLVSVENLDYVRKGQVIFCLGARHRGIFDANAKKSPLKLNDNILPVSLDPS